MPATQALRRPEVTVDSLRVTQSVALEIEPAEEALDTMSLETTVKYAGYLEQERSRARRARLDEARAIPKDTDFSGVPGLSREVRERLLEVQPETLGQAGRIPGVTPAAVALIGSVIRRMPNTIA